MNGNDSNSNPQHNNQKLIVWCVFILGLSCAGTGGWLTYKGYNGELLIGGGTSAIAGLLGVLSNRTTQPNQPDVTFSAGPPATATVSSNKQPEEPNKP